MSGSWSLVTYRGAADRDRVGALRADGAVVAVDPLDRFAEMMDVLAAWPVASRALRDWDPARGEVLEGVELLAPIRFPKKLICAGANYASHVEEMGVSIDWDRIPPPFFFLKPASSTVIGPGSEILIPDEDARVDWEGELAVVIGRTAHRISPEEAPASVAGYTIVNDITARGYHQRPDALAPPFAFDWLRSKGRDTFCPMGPGMVPSWFVDDPHALSIRLSVNGGVKQDCPTSDMLVGVWDLIAAASEIMTLEPGDVIATGTPPGVGAGRGEFLSPGDLIDVEIPGLGRLTNPVARET